MQWSSTTICKKYKILNEKGITVKKIYYGGPLMLMLVFTLILIFQQNIYSCWFVCFDVTSHVGINCAGSSVCQARYFNWEGHRTII